ncbi:carbohydrate-binding family 9-like protein [Roseibacillus persicicus]|uniref:Carbohydrate-binding domain-containing protein n=1 Tax=Roseibacillus persicicus TaxID=454148 RepID=A0A918TV60_9BACT|nr:carbohydrate-binding family 9-like protein [Roseibacillus persicicus]GHC63350.1 hypothetical protein GCM10007100_33660 [Roseibacillus persicicus]
MPDDDWKPEMRKRYHVHRLRSEASWQVCHWTDEFVDITGKEELKPRFRTRVKMAWDEEFLHVRAEMEEPHVWGTIKKQNEVIFHDNDFEVFIDPDCDGLNYYEFEMNALGTIWELSLPKPYNQGGEPIWGCNMEGLRKKVIVHGTLNNPRSEDDGWDAHVSFPWAELKKYHKDAACPPKPGDIWRINFSRVQWKHPVKDGKYVRVPPHGSDLTDKETGEMTHPEDNWVWSPQGVINMHLPLRWGEIEFV